MSDLKQDEVKAALKNALKEWLDEKFIEVGKWTVHGVIAAALAGLAYLLLWGHGWRPGTH